MKKPLVMTSKVVFDFLSALGIPTSSLDNLVGEYQTTRRNEAMLALVEAIEKGEQDFRHLDPEEIDPMVRITLRYVKAVQTGAAIENLKLLASIIAGQKRNRTLNYDKFSKWASCLESLSRDQLLVIGYALRFEAERFAMEQFWTGFQQKMKTAAFDTTELELICASLVHFGLFKAINAWGGIVYEPTRWLIELGQIAEMQNIHIS